MRQWGKIHLFCQIFLKLSQLYEGKKLLYIRQKGVSNFEKKILYMSLQTQKWRGQWAVYYASLQSFTNIFSYSLAFGTY